MKNHLFSFAICLLTYLPSIAQDWQTNIDTAKQIATEKNRPIILVFQGSDWCAPCIKLNREVFSTETFSMIPFRVKG
jgi:thiol-disulfide isomerase/thioredoxin